MSSGRSALTVASGIDLVPTQVERQRAYAYARKHLLMVEAEVSHTKERLTSFARESGLELAAIFIEQIETRPSAFERMLRAVIRDKVEVVILPSMLHFAVLGAPTNVKQYFEAASGARVVTMLDAVSHSLGEAVS